MLLVHAALLNVSKAGMISIHLCQLRNKYYMWFNTYYLKVTCLRYDFTAGLTEINLCLSCTATEGCKFPKDSLVLLYKFSSTSSATPAAGVLVSIFFFFSHTAEALRQSSRDYERWHSARAELFTRLRTASHGDRATTKNTAQHNKGISNTDLHTVLQANSSLQIEL